MFELDFIAVAIETAGVWGLHAMELGSLFGISGKPSLYSEVIAYRKIFMLKYLKSQFMEFGSLPDQLPAKQSSWNRPRALFDKALVESSLGQLLRKQPRTSLAVSAAQSGYWLFARSITSCGLRLDNETVRVAVSLRLGSNLCVPHVYGCEARVDDRGFHCFVCERAPCRINRHHALNDIVARAFVSAGIPAAPPQKGQIDSQR